MQVAATTTEIVPIGSPMAAPTRDPLQGAATRELEASYEMIRKLASTNAVVVFSMSRCCMCTVATRLLFSLGVGPAIIELDTLEYRPSISDGIMAVLHQLASPNGQQPIPAVFVGGNFLGGIEKLMACHINGTLVPLLKDAGALWL